ncbi:hypothetical protein M413DRAFT_13232 [Hebeloma cylindrosporum]|uniref:Glutathione S-transferase UstS-like C-terminal domain-containing protein n=1 Tax=Hebeloma cylindrosporum TaxID=76867 RepID=A0A0C3BLC9_HEBCY|nr:hypothetical protein M413DRAFT_13232 [Hebeloma cylindrosporum h7]
MSGSQWAERAQRFGISVAVVNGEIIQLNPRSEEYFPRTKEKSFGKAMENVIPKVEVGAGERAKFKEGMRKIDARYAKNGSKKPFLLGGTPAWGDITIASYVRWMGLFGERDSQ